MKKFLPIIMAALLVLGIAGCSQSEKTETTAKSGASAESASSQTVTENEKSNVLVAYFSATGNTKKIAESIAEKTGADIFVITPEDEYTSEDLDWTNENSRVSIEHNDPEKRNVSLVTTTPENFDDYDTVFIGYPIWWGSAAWPVDSFVKGNDFTGKTVIPFCTSASSDIGDSGSLLEESASTGDWQQGKRFDGNTSAEEVNSWIDSLDY